MYEVLLIIVALVTAITCIQQLVRLDRLAREFLDVAKVTRSGPTDIFEAMVNDTELDRHQHMLRTEAVAAFSLLLLSFSCLLGAVIVSW